MFFVIFVKLAFRILRLHTKIRNLHSFFLEFQGTPVPPDILKIGRKYGQTGLQEYKYYQHSDCIEAIQLLSLQHSKYCQDYDRVNHFFLKFLFRYNM